MSFHLIVCVCAHTQTHMFRFINLENDIGCNGLCFPFNITMCILILMIQDRDDGNNTMSKCEGQIDDIKTCIDNGTCKQPLNTIHKLS